ncbi:hypothetical protein CEXT_31951 [Caerostris extrusa]|uniref:Uncharacterized protein n=1 Tax=Caerostris extrusa TaxID=172846 RepID=A0AAV4RYD5_CAEEX|nr:hypothetical protein CEXT_31951 [Caerostris extrusa]
MACCFLPKDMSCRDARFVFMSGVFSAKIVLCEQMLHGREREGLECIEKHIYSDDIFEHMYFEGKLTLIWHCFVLPVHSKPSPMISYRHRSTAMDAQYTTIKSRSRGQENMAKAGTALTTNRDIPEANAPIYCSFFLLLFIVVSAKPQRNVKLTSYWYCPCTSL